MTFLGHVVCKDRIIVDLIRIEVIRDLFIPTSSIKVHIFIGLEG